MSGDPVRIRLEPLAVELEVARGGSLVAALAAHGIEFPCGGTGECEGCSIRVLSGSLPITESDAAIFTPDQLAAGWRLACQARPESPLVLECAQWHMEILADSQSGRPTLSEAAPADSESVGTHQPQPAALNPPKNLGAPGPSHLGTGERTNPQQTAIAIDLGTTTIAAQLIDANTGDVLGVETMLNPQAAFGSDVMSRVRAALEGSDLTSPIRIALGQLVARLAAGRESQVAEVLLVGNTVMHHLFCALSVEPLSHVPFASPCLAEQRFTPRDLAWNFPADCIIRFARCIGGFVGSDILAGIVATGLAQRDDFAALVDLGTNGEIAIGNRDGIVCASTAAGPAFEAGAIRMGMRAVTGAIAYVALRDGQLHATVIGDAPPRGICGSGLVDAIAAGLRSGAILPSGRVANGTKLFPVAPPVVLYQSDIRELQLAKAAIAAGFRLLLKQLRAPEELRKLRQVSPLKGHDFSRAISIANEEGALAPEGKQALHSIHLAGAFGNYVQIDSALRIGLLEAPHNLIHAAGNTALRGAKMLLLADREPTLPPIQHISLAADPAFQDEFANCMTFPENL
jgi:uncharacterized 2Fe-2S/4Fe-4S cluster protein (DUF4445 family)